MAVPLGRPTSTGLAETLSLLLVMVCFIFFLYCLLALGSFYTTVTSNWVASNGVVSIETRGGVTWSHLVQEF